MQLSDAELVDLGDARTATYALAPRKDSSRGDVVFCHGTPWSASTWMPVARALDFGWRVFLWDMPGYGQSTQDPHVALDLESQMARFAQLTSMWDLHEPYVVAHDIGGAVALGAHLLHKVDYGGLFLWDAVTLMPWGSPFFQLVASHPDVFAQLPPALHTALVREYIAGAAARPIGSEVVGALSEPWLELQGRVGFYRQIASLRPEHTRPVEERLSAVRCRTAVGWGSEDPWIPVEQASRLQNALPACAPLVVVDGAGHLTPLEAPAEVTRAVDTWLEDASTP